MLAGSRTKLSALKEQATALLCSAATNQLQQPTTWLTGQLRGRASPALEGDCVPHNFGRHQLSSNLFILSVFLECMVPSLQKILVRMLPRGWRAFRAPESLTCSRGRFQRAQGTHFWYTPSIATAACQYLRSRFLQHPVAYSKICHLSILTLTTPVLDADGQA